MITIKKNTLELLEYFMNLTSGDMNRYSMTIDSSVVMREIALNARSIITFLNVQEKGNEEKTLQEVLPLFRTLQARLLFINDIETIYMRTEMANEFSRYAKIIEVEYSNLTKSYYLWHLKGSINHIKDYIIR